MLYLLIFSGSFLIVIFLAPFLIDALTRLKVVDYPGGRKRHSVPVPRAGGILIFIPLLCSLLVFNNIPYSKTLLFSSSLIMLCGLKDDICGVRWYNKYFMHSLASLIFIFFFYPGMNKMAFFGFPIPFPFDVLVLFFFVTGVINSINMLDGLDGLVTGYALLIFTMIFMLSVSHVNSAIIVICSAMMGSLIGFLKFNAFPAKIFLGDTGSMLIGFFLAVSALILSNSFNKTGLDMAFSIILLGLPVVDMIKVIFIRLKRKKSPFLPDRSHIHHKIEDNNIHHKHSVFIIQLLTLGFIFSAVCCISYNFLIASALFILLSSILIFFNRCNKLFPGGQEKNLLTNFISLSGPVYDENL